MFGEDNNLRIPYTNIKLFEIEQPVAQDTFNEISDYESSYYAKSQLAPYNPDELEQRKGGLEIYDTMGNDDQIKATLTMKKQSILSSGWKIEPASDNPRDIEIADFITYAYTEGIKGTFSDELFEILSGLDYGFSVSEKLFQVYNKGKWKGKTGLLKIKTRPPHSFEFHTDRHGNIEFILQHGAEDEIILPLWKFIIFTYNPQFENPYGRSDLRAVYRSWWSKNNIIKFWNIYLERYGMPTVKATTPKNATKEQKDNIDAIMKNLQSKTGIRAPEGFDFALLEAQKRGDSGYKDAVQEHNKMIARGILLPDLLGYTDTKSGSYALGQKQFDLFELILNRLRQQVQENIVDEQTTKQLVDFNFPNVTDYPKFKLNPLTEKDTQALSTIFVDAVDKGVISSRPEDESYIRETLSFPPVDPEQIERERKEKSDKEALGAERDRQDKIDREAREDEMRRSGQPDEDTVPVGKPFIKTYKLNRQPNKFEKQIDFARIERETADSETKIVDDATTVIRKMQDSLINIVMSKKTLEKKDINAVNELTLKHLGDLRLIFKEELRKIYSKGRIDANIVIKDKVKSTFQKVPVGIPPTKAIQWLNDNSVVITGQIRDNLLNGSKQAIMTALKQGKTTKELMLNLEEVFTPFVDTQVLPGEVLSPWRLETIARTKMNEAYNMGQEEIYAESTVVEAYEYSAIIDSRTSDYCSAMDGQVFKKSDGRFNFPPAHPNCRSLIIPVVQGEEFDLSKKNPQEPAKGVKRTKGM